MKLKLKELKQNPFKKFINDGKLNEDRIQLLIESIEHGTLPEHFFARKVEDNYELTSGHHRVEALKIKKGKNHEVDVTIVSYNDEQMLVDMVRENMTQRDTDFHDTLQSVVLARGWLTTKDHNDNFTVKLFDSEFKKQGIHKKGLHGTEPQKDSYRSIATFLSKKGKAVSHESVRSYLKMNDDLDEDLLKRTKKVKGSAIDNEEKGVLPVRDALSISGIKNKEEQKTMADIILNSDIDSGAKRRKLITIYKEAPEEIKKKVRKREIDLKDVEEAIIEYQIKESNKGKPITEFIPNFKSRVDDFSYNVTRLEQQVALFRKVFYSKGFTQRYNTLGKKEKQFLGGTIQDIHKRIKKCYGEVESFMSQLDQAKKESISLEV